MERVALLIEGTNERLRCLLNPESLVLRRRAGIQPRHSATGRLTGEGLADDPLLYTGGGYTELQLDLLFDVSLASSTVSRDDVRELTAPLWRLAENWAEGGAGGRPPLVRFIWGKSWNIPGVVVAVAERLESFTSGGTPQRSWLRMRLLRAEAEAARSRARQPSFSPAALAAASLSVPESAVRVHEHLGGGAGLGLAPALPVTAMSVGTSLTVAADILAAAIAETPAGAWLLSVGGRISAAVESAVAGIQEWLATPSPVTQAIREGLDKLRASAAEMASAAKARIVSTATAVAARASAAIRSMAETAKKLVSPAERAVARAIEGLLDNVRPLASALPRAAAVVARAVRAKAAAVIAVAVPYIESGARAIASAAQAAGEMASEAGQKAMQGIRSALDAIAERMAGVRETSKAVAMHTIGPVLGQIAAASSVLWATGKRAAARAIAGAVTRIGMAFKNIAEADEALGLVAVREPSEALAPAADALGASVREETAEDAEAPAQTGDAWANLEGRVEALAPLVQPALLAPVTAARDTIREALADLDVPERREGAVAQIADAVQQVKDAVEPLVEAAEQSTAEVIVAAIAGRAEEAEGGEGAEQAGGAPPARPEMPTPPATRLAAGERLDQLAYRYYGNAAFWRLLAVFNEIDDPMHLGAGRLLRVPPASAMGEVS